MTKDKKQLLLKDLCARLPYGVICHTEEGDGHLCSIDQTIFGNEYGLNISPIKRDYFNDSEQDEVVIKPYLRPMSSMTEDEKKNVHYYVESHKYGNCSRSGVISDYLNSIHVDYRGLIEKGLALEAPDNMYKTE